MSFSNFTIVKTGSKSSLNHDRLDYLILMNVHKNETKILSLDKVAEDFIAPNERKSFVVGVKKYNE